MRFRAAWVIVPLLLAAACGGAPSDDDATAKSAPTPTATPTVPTAASTVAPAVRYPGSAWARSERGDWSELDAILARDGSTCVAVIKDGVLVHDGYWNGGGAEVPQRVYSITKSLSSLLVGMYVDGGEVDLDGSASEQVDEWRGGPAEEVTVRSLLAMTSGRHGDESADRHMIRVAPDKTAYSVGVAQDRGPDEGWSCDNVAAQTLESVLDDVDETDDVVDIAQRRLFGPIGMRHTTWARDAAGNALTFSGVESTCHDLARVGHLMLNEGTWKGEQLLSADYVEQATSPSSAHNAAYGLMWWTNGRGRIVEVLRQAGFADDKAPYDGPRTSCTGRCVLGLRLRQPVRRGGAERGSRRGAARFSAGDPRPGDVRLVHRRCVVVGGSRSCKPVTV
ncbi:serine hydrolase domain-containing protein [Aeromicrobium sp. UC242_57]|uniref:serine hydrolase domain-containing protein n=1 Tax=Aeromicrobium sp. UC242_57 TaxID=3374624 RepID=UPI0037AA494B